METNEVRRRGGGLFRLQRPLRPPDPGDRAGGSSGCARDGLTRRHEATKGRDSIEGPEEHSSSHFPIRENGNASEGVG